PVDEGRALHGGANQDGGAVDGGRADDVLASSAALAVAERGRDVDRVLEHTRTRVGRDAAADGDHLGRITWVIRAQVVPVDLAVGCASDCATVHHPPVGRTADGGPGRTAEDNGVVNSLDVGQVAVGAG